VPELTISLLHDAQQMLQTYCIPMTSHALHVYHSALVTMPRCSLLDVTTEPLRARELGWNPRRGLEGHASTVFSVMFSPDGTRMASGSEDRTVRIWDTQTGGQLALLQGHNHAVWFVGFSPDGTHILSGSFDKTVRIWDTQTGKQLALLDGHTSAVRCAVCSPDGTRIASGSEDKTVRIWDTQTGGELALLKGHTDAVRSVVFSLDGTRIASGSWDRTVRIWDTQTGRQLAKLQHRYAVHSVAFFPNMKHLVVHDFMGQETQWDVDSISASCFRVSPRFAKHSLTFSASRFRFRTRT
jgi:WD40 repeat protein